MNLQKSQSYMINPLSSRTFELLDLLEGVRNNEKGESKSKTGESRLA